MHMRVDRTRPCKSLSGVYLYFRMHILSLGQGGSLASESLSQSTIAPNPLDADLSPDITLQKEKNSVPTLMQLETMMVPMRIQTPHRAEWRTLGMNGQPPSPYIRLDRS